MNASHRSAATVLVAWVACACATPTTSTPATTTPPPTTTTTADPRITWDVTMSPGFVAEEKLCWDGPMTRVMPEVALALPYATAAFDEEGRALEVGARGIELPPDVRCATLTLDLGKAAREIDDRNNIGVRNGTLMTSPDIWLWRPEPWPTGATGALALHLPDGMGASVPWQRRGSGDDARYVVPASTWRLMSKCAFGALSTRAVEVGDATFTISRLPGQLRASDAGLERWLKSAAGAVSLVGGGRFPVRRAQVMLVPVDGGGAIPFGMAIRGGGPAAVVLVSARASDDDLLGEWVGVHELSHLLIPPVERRDAWLSEGLASYYQQVLRGRSGLLDHDVAWGALVDGFDRGRAGAHDRPLSSASRHMYDDYGFVTVYWGGAAILFKLDVALREKGRSLDALVADVRRREPVDTGYRAADVVVGWWAEEAPDVDVRGIVASGLASRFPDVEEELAALGVTRGGDDGTARLDDAAREAAIRRAIMGES